MNLKKTLKIILFGIAIWIVPFLSGFLFYTSDGQLSIDIFLFKSLMLIVLLAVTSVAIYVHFKKIAHKFIRQGVVIGMVWLCIVLILDIIILIPVSEMNTTSYINEIGLRYLLVPIMSIFSGFLLHRNQE